MSYSRCGNRKQTNTTFRSRVSFVLQWRERHPGVVSSIFLPPKPSSLHPSPILYAAVARAIFSENPCSLLCAGVSRLCRTRVTRALRDGFRTYHRFLTASPRLASPRPAQNKKERKKKRKGKTPTSPYSSVRWRDVLTPNRSTHYRGCRSLRSITFAGANSITILT